MSALDAAYRALTRVRSVSAPRCCCTALRFGCAAHNAVSAQSNVVNVAFVITGALVGERVRADAPAHQCIALVVCSTAKHRAPSATARRAARHTWRAAAAWRAC